MIILVLGIILFSGCTKMMSNSNYNEDIEAISILSEEEKLILLGQKYQYELKIDKSIVNILNSISVNPLEIYMLNNPPTLNLDNSIKMEFYISYPLKLISKDKIKYLKSLGFYTYENVVANPDGIMMKFERIAKRSNKNQNLNSKHVNKSSTFVVYEEATRNRIILATILKPLTVVVDMIILLFGLILYAFKT